MLTLRAESESLWGVLIGAVSLSEATQSVDLDLSGVGVGGSGGGGSMSWSRAGRCRRIRVS